MAFVDRLAPEGEQVVEYDRRHLALYAALMEAVDAGRSWQESAATLMQLDVDAEEAETCWRSHLDRARWLVGDGLKTAMIAFNVSSGPRR